MYVWNKHRWHEVMMVNDYKGWEGVVKIHFIFKWKKIYVISKITLSSTNIHTFHVITRIEKQTNCQRRMRKENGKKSNFNRILFPPSLWWSFFSSLSFFSFFNPPFSPRPYIHFPFATLTTHSLSYVQIPPSLSLSSQLLWHIKRAFFSSLHKRSLQKKKRFYKMKWYSSEEREREGEQNHQELFLSNFLCVSFCCSWNDKWWKDIDMKKKVSFVVRGLNTHGWMIAKWEKSWKSPAREIRARE